MRPPDENQANPTQPQQRPNLMSSARRGGNEDSILAKLEREPARHAWTGGGGRVLWYGGAVVLALGLTATLAWLAAGLGNVESGLEVAHADVAPLLVPAHAPEAPLEAAVIVDAPAPADDATSGVGHAEVSNAEVNHAEVSTAEVLQPPLAPSLRLLEPAGARSALVKAAAVPAAAPPPVIPAAPRPPARPAGTAERNLARTAPARPRAPAPRQAARTAKSASAARASETPDSDVALISAVIYHANGHAVPEPGDSLDACADGACRPRPAR